MAKKDKRGRMGSKARERAQNREKSGGGGTKFNFPEGSEVSFFTPTKKIHNLDFLPYEVTVDNHPDGIDVGERWYKRKIWVHFGIGAEDKSYNCLKTVGKKCPICVARAEMIKSGADQELTDSYKPKEREVYNVIDKDDEDKGVQLFEISYFNFGQLLDETLEDADDDDANFAELEDGRTLKIKFKDKKFGGNTFKVATRIDFEERDEDYDEDILDDVLNLDEILNILSYKALEDIFTQGEEVDEDDEPKNKKNKGKKKKDEEDDDGDEEEDSKPPSKKRKDKKKSKSEDEEDEEDEDDRKSSKSKKSKKGKSSSNEDDEEDDEKSSKKSSKHKDKDQECPEGYDWGEADEYEECCDCDVWKKCKKASK